MADFDNEYRRDWYDDLDAGHSVRPQRGVPGKTTLTARLAPPAQTNIVFRATDAQVAQAFGSRDSNGVAENASVEVDRAAAGSGSPLPDNLQSKFERSIGTDLSSVRIHNDERSAQAAQALGARAYAVGSDIYFNQGQYDPTSSTGERLLAHEVAHTAQQSGPGPTPTPQPKLLVSTAVDAAEVEADRAADAMVAGSPATASLTETLSGIGPKVFREVDPSYGQLEGAGDEAADRAMHDSLTVDTVSVTRDVRDADEMVADITKNEHEIEKAEDADIPNKQTYVATNTEAIAKLSIFKDKLSVSTVDTSAFAVQYRVAHADFLRLTAEAHEYLSTIGVNSNDDLSTVTKGMGDTNLKLDASVQLSDFQAARRNLNTAATKMNSKLGRCRGAANSLQAAIYKARSAAAAAKEKADQGKLKDVKNQIAEVAGGVGKVVKLVTAVAGFAGGGSATEGAAGAVSAPRTAVIEGSDPGMLKGTKLGDMLEAGTPVDLDPEGHSKMEMIKAMYGDAGKLDVAGTAIMSGDPAKMAEALVTAIGNYANKTKISNLQTSITKAAAEVKAFESAAASLDMVGKQETLKSSADDLSIEVRAFHFAKQDLAEKGEALMAVLAKKGKQGGNQAKGVLFLSDADRFLSQVQNAISVGENQQDNMKLAAEDRKNLRGTAANEDGQDRNTQHYYRCKLLGKKPWYRYGTNYYKIDRMNVTFTNTGDLRDPNSLNQGGAGAVEGVGGAQDMVATEIKTLKDAQTKVKQLQTACQNALFGAGKGQAGLNG